MLGSLVDKLKKTVKQNAAPAAESPDTPDISRVIELPRANEAGHDAPDASDPVNMADRAEAAVDSLSSQFEQWMRSDLDQLIAAWAAAKNADAGPDEYRNLFMTAHNIRGAAGSYGFPSISRLCGSLSNLLTTTKPGENSALINLHIEACRAAFNPAGKSDGGKSVADAVCTALEAKVAAIG